MLKLAGGGKRWESRRPGGGGVPRIVGGSGAAATSELLRQMVQRCCEGGGGVLLRRMDVANCRARRARDASFSRASAPLSAGPAVDLSGCCSGGLVAVAGWGGGEWACSVIFFKMPQYRRRSGAAWVPETERSSDARQDRGLKRAKRRLRGPRGLAPLQVAAALRCTLAPSAAPRQRPPKCWPDARTPQPGLHWRV